MKARTPAPAQPSPARSFGFLAPLSIALVFAVRLECPGATPAIAQSLAPTVELEEDVYSFEPANNGAGPMWCSGSTCLVRVVEDVFVSGLETL